MTGKISLAVLATATILCRLTDARPQHHHSHTPRGASTIDDFYAINPPTSTPADSATSTSDDFYAIHPPTSTPADLATSTTDDFYAIHPPTSTPAGAARVTSTIYATLTVTAGAVTSHGTVPQAYHSSGFAPFPAGTGGLHGQNGSRTAYPTGTAGTVKPSQTNGTHTAGPTGTETAVPALPSTLRGVNLGGWLILEKWMNADCFEGTDAVDQWTFDQTEGAVAKLKQHWETYITEDDIKKIASWGLNAVRIPIGFWAYDTFGSGYISGADVYLEKAIGWCRAAGIKVLVDCHGSPGSQNGFDNSGKSGDVAWQDESTSNGTTNLEKSISVLQTMARKYGSLDYADVVFGLELVNEPISWQQNNFATTKTWAQQAYTAVRATAANQNLQIIMHDAFMGPAQWLDVHSALTSNNTASNSTVPPFAIDTHLYQNQMAADSALTQDQHVHKACNWTTSALLPASATLPVYVGEFSAQTNICANPDNSTVAGSTCWTEGCQCSSNVAIENWDGPLVRATRRFVEAELDAFEKASRGWFMWSYKGPGAWGMANLVEFGVMGNVGERMYPRQCGW